MKHEWRKKEKNIYLPKTKPAVVEVPEYQYVTICGEGNPNNDSFSEYITALYTVSYAIKMTLKKRTTLAENNDYTVYPLEGIWDISEAAKKTYEGGKINKDDLVFQLMIRQPSFVTTYFFEEMLTLTKSKKQLHLLDKIKFEKISDGKCIQMMHIGPYENEDVSFGIMEDFALSHGLLRSSKVHREIYLSDFRKVPPEKLKTVLRFKVENK